MKTLDNLKIGGKPREDFEVIDDTGMVKKRQGWSRAVVVKHTVTVGQAVKIQTYRISVYLDSYDFQSYARLYLLNEKKEWTRMASRNPGNGYPDTLLSSSMDDKFRKQFTAGTRTAKGTEFDVVIVDLLNVAERITMTLEG
jgi:hypothetical protein